MSLLDLIFPKYCLSCRVSGKYLCDSCLKVMPPVSPICPNCHHYSSAGTTHPFCKSTNSLDGLVSLYSYQGVIRKGILGLKYRFATDITSELSEICINRIPSSLCKDSSVCLVPIPLAPNRLRTRGFNQSELIGNKIAKHFNWKYIPDLLLRIQASNPQTKLNRADRLKNVANVFAINPNSLIPDHYSLILFDDVFTTGATLNEAAKTLKTAGIKTVWGLTIAR